MCIRDRYFFENNIPMDRRIATTLTYGVRIDTNNLSRGVSKLDIEMLYRMFDECDYEIIHMLENSNLCFDELMAYSSAISSIEVYDDISFCNTGKDCPVIANRCVEETGICGRMLYLQMRLIILSMVEKR